MLKDKNFFFFSFSDICFKNTILRKIKYTTDFYITYNYIGSRNNSMEFFRYFGEHSLFSDSGINVSSRIKYLGLREIKKIMLVKKNHSISEIFLNVDEIYPKVKLVNCTFDKTFNVKRLGNVVSIEKRKKEVISINDFVSKHLLRRKEKSLFFKSNVLNFSMRGFNFFGFTSYSSLYYKGKQCSYPLLYNCFYKKFNGVGFLEYLNILFTERELEKVIIWSRRKGARYFKKH